MHESDAPLVYLFKRPFSGQFYSAGRALEVRDGAEVARWLATDKPATLLVPDARLRPPLARDRRALGRSARHGGYVMLRKRQAP